MTEVNISYYYFTYLTPKHRRAGRAEILLGTPVSFPLVPIASLFAMAASRRLTVSLILATRSSHLNRILYYNLYPLMDFILDTYSEIHLR